MASTDREQYYFELDTIVEDAKEKIIQEGKYPPKAFVEGKIGSIETELPEIPEAYEDKLAYMAALGQLMAESGSIGELLQVFVVSGGSLWKTEKAIHLEFSETTCTEAKPVLIVSGVQLEERKKNLIIFEVLKGSEKQVVGFLDLLLETDIGIPLETPLEDGFIAGFHGAVT
ncbi:MAG: hypothetical protein H6634_13415 [Anaerolineales bacterium]|nr:hypothetical protein [Anaerolineales bacterium]